MYKNVTHVQFFSEGLYALQYLAEMPVGLNMGDN
jgi:hypothetical protein